jgi:hypothetical protein
LFLLNIGLFCDNLVAFHVYVLRETAKKLVIKNLTQAPTLPEDFAQVKRF